MSAPFPNALILQVSNTAGATHKSPVQILSLKINLNNKIDNER
jgi:hypothetical protein